MLILFFCLYRFAFYADTFIGMADLKDAAAAAMTAIFLIIWSGAIG
jgi:hypothetical protein